MASIEKRGDGQYRAKVRKTGFPSQSETFESYAEALAWATDTEAKMNRGEFKDRRVAMSVTLREMVERYEKEVTPTKRGARQERYQLNILKTCMLADRPFGSITSDDVIDLREERLKHVGPATTIKTMNLLSAVYRQAKEWKVPVDNPVTGVKRPERPEGRTRRPTDEELTWIFAETQSKQLANAILVAIETAMRRGELANALKEHFFPERRTLVLFETKNGEGRAVPLSSKVMAILLGLNGNPKDTLFGMRPDSITQAFGRARKRARAKYEKAQQLLGLKPDPNFLVNLRVHDMRHEATSRLFEIHNLNVAEAAAVTGHKDLRSLKTYTHLNASKLAEKLG